MDNKKQSTSDKISTQGTEQISFSVEPGTRLQITIDVGEKVVDGKVSLTVHVEKDVSEQDLAVEAAPPVSRPLPHFGVKYRAARLATWFDTLKSRLGVYDLATWLFLSALAIYLVTRLIGLTQFPIYFFTDEAIQTQSIMDLVRDGYKDQNDTLLPTYFRNGEYYNLGLSVYLQWLPYMLFGKSAVVTRATSVLVTLIAAISVGLLLRDVFRLRYWWTGTLLLSITPAWFLHSRTAFETAEFVAFYAGALTAYLFYRHKSPRYIYLAIFLGALAFYTYSPGQMIVPLTALGLLISDWRYHWENRRFLLWGLLFILILALPYLRSILNNPNVPVAHLRTLYSYWFEEIPVSEKLVRYLSEFGLGLSPWYWYLPNARDLPRHLMKDYGHIGLATLPFALLGMAYVLRNIRLPACRAVLIALLVSPAAAALVQVSITRTLGLVVPAAILTAIGLEQVLQWIENPKGRLDELAAGEGPTSRRVVMALVVVLIGAAIAFAADESIDRIAIVSLSILLALQVSGALEQLARLAQRSDFFARMRWRLSQTVLVLAAFFILAASNISMLNDALRNGPLWYRDYGMGGMQYGAFQIFDIIKQYLRERPNTKIIFSPDWANGTDVVARFFLGDPSPIQIASVRGHIVQPLPLDDDTLFVITPQEYAAIMNEKTKLKDIQVERIVPYPDGNPGFYFVRLHYADNIDEIFAAEKAVRQVLQEAVVVIDGQEVKVRFSYLDSSIQEQSIALLFDNDPFTLAKTYENNPFFIELTFPEPRTLTAFSINIGATTARITLRCRPAPDAEPVVYTFEGLGTREQPELMFELPEPTELQVLEVEMLDPHAGEPAKIHIWELKLR